MVVLKNVTKKIGEYKKVKSLYLSAFPKNERISFCLLRYLAWRKKAEFFSINYDEEFIGLLYICSKDDLTFIFYFAIDEEKRSKGFGKKVLDFVKEKYKGQRIFLNIEEPNENSKNNSQRLKRKSFYENNDFKISSTYKDKTENYLTMSFNGEVSSNEFLKFYKWLKKLI